MFKTSSSQKQTVCLMQKLQKVLEAHDLYLQTSRNADLSLVDISAPKRIFSPPPPNSPICRRHPPATSAPPPPRHPPCGIFNKQSRPPPPGASNSPFPLPEQKKIKDIRNVHQVSVWQGWKKHNWEGMMESSRERSCLYKVGCLVLRLGWGVPCWSFPRDVLEGSGGSHFSCLSGVFL